MDDTVSAQALRDSEELHRITLLNMSDAVFITTDAGAFTFICPNVDVIFGYSCDEVQAMERIPRLLGRELIDAAGLAARGELRNIEHAIVTKRGERRDLLVHVKRVSIKEGTMLYACRDITERKQSEQALRELGGQLINAHEQERIRLSRELHDEFGQRIALLSTELALLRKQLSGGSPATHDQVAKMASEAAEIGSAVHRLSHNLHPSRLEQLGLEASIRMLCRELGETGQVAIEFQVGDVSTAVEFDTALCLYRVAQEALHNIVKHSGATHATIGLGRDAHELVMSVVDNGAGFDTTAIGRKGTLGLISMRERARLVQASLAVTSQPGYGTRLEIRAPLVASHGSN
jgi:PAS domain S-box-containing protein